MSHTSPTRGAHRCPTSSRPASDAGAHDATVQEPGDDATPHEPLDEPTTWLDEEPRSCPPRPRRRLLTPLPLALLGVLLIACGFIGGVLVRRARARSSSSAGRRGRSASRFAALRGGGGGRRGASGSSAAALPRAARGGGAAAAAGSGPPAASARRRGRDRRSGRLRLAASTLYVTTAEGNTVKVTTAPGVDRHQDRESRASKASIQAKRSSSPARAGANGAVSAELDHACGGAVGGLGALFGGGGGAGGAARRPGGGGGGEGAAGGGRRVGSGRRTGEPAPCECAPGDGRSSLHDKGAMQMRHITTSIERAPAATRSIRARRLGLAACGGGSSSSRRGPPARRRELRSAQPAHSRADQFVAALRAHCANACRRTGSRCPTATPEPARARRTGPGGPRSAGGPAGGASNLPNGVTPRQFQQPR